MISHQTAIIVPVKEELENYDLFMWINGWDGCQQLTQRLDIGGALHHLQHLLKGVRRSHKQWIRNVGGVSQFLVNRFDARQTSLAVYFGDVIGEHAAWRHNSVVGYKSLHNRIIGAACVSSWVW